MHPILAKIDELELTIANSTDVTPEHVGEAHRLLDQLRVAMKHLPHGAGDVPGAMVANG